MVRHILHMDLDTFFVSVERLQNSRLNGQPVIVGGTSDRGVVASCSYEARQFGVHSAMPAKLARQLCPQAIFIRGDYDAYSKYSRMVTGILQEKAPVVEKASIDEHYIDLTREKRYKWYEKEVVISGGYRLKDNEDIAVLSIVSFFYGSLSLGLLSAIIRMMNHVLAIIINIVWALPLCLVLPVFYHYQGFGYLSQYKK